MDGSVKGRRGWRRGWRSWGRSWGSGVVADMNARGKTDSAPSSMSVSPSRRRWWRRRRSGWIYEPPTPVSPPSSISIIRRSRPSSPTTMIPRSILRIIPSAPALSCSPQLAVVAATNSEMLFMFGPSIGEVEEDGGLGGAVFVDGVGEAHSWEVGERGGRREERGGRGGRKGVMGKGGG